MQVKITGHTDNIGDGEFNMWLSRKRTVVIYEILTARGINGNRLSARGYGATRPLASNDDEIDGRALNRRTEIVVVE